MRGHVPALDGLRGVAILLVLCRHTTLLPSQDVPSALLSFVQGSGWIGVDLFFVLSGFLISGILLDLDRSSKALLAFYARRAIRIWPLYLLAVAIGVLVLPGLDVFGSISTNGRAWEWLLFVQNLDTRPNPPQLGILWSLAVEEQMYLGLPLLILFLPRRQLALTLIAIVLLAPCWRSAAMLLGAPAAANYIFTPARADVFAVGSLLAVVARSGGLQQFGRWPWLIGAVCGAVFVGLGVSLYDFDPFQVPMQTLGYSVVALLFGAMLVSTLQSPRLSALVTWGPLRRFGRYSYAIYLFHFPLWLVLSPRLWQPTVLGSLWPAQLLATAVMIATCFVGGWLSWTLIERHILALKRFVPYATEPSSAREQRTPLSTTTRSRFLPELGDCVHLGPEVSLGPESLRRQCLLTLVLHLDRLGARQGKAPSNDGSALNRRTIIRELRGTGQQSYCIRDVPQP